MPVASPASSRVSPRLFALALQKPAGFSGRIACAIGLFAEANVGGFVFRFVPAKIKLWVVHGLTLSALPSINYLLTLTFRENDAEW